VNLSLLLEEHTLQIGTSIGIAIGLGAAADADRLIKEADIALYRAKAEGADRFRRLVLSLPASGSRPTTRATSAASGAYDPLNNLND